MIALGLEVRVVCPVCRDMIPVNALAETFVCPACGARAGLAAQEWARLLRGPLLRLLFVPPYREEQVKNRQEKGKQEKAKKGKRKAKETKEPAVLFTLLREVPRFPGSGNPVPAPVGDAETISDPATGAEFSCRPVPAPFHELLPEVVCLGGERPGSPADGPPPAAVGEVTLPCSQCGADLRADGRSRLLSCPFCSAETFLPDGTWRKLHPVTPAIRWYAWLDPTRLRYEHLPWKSVEFALGDAPGNAYIRGEVQALGNVFASFAADGSLRWISRDPRLIKTEYGHGGSCCSPGRGDRLLYWSEDLDEIAFYSVEDGTVLRNPPGVTPFGNGGPGGMQDTDWVLYDLSGSALIYRGRRSFNPGRELLRLKEDGERLSVWEKDGETAPPGLWKRLTRSALHAGSPPLFWDLRHRWEFCYDQINLVWQGLDGSYYFSYDWQEGAAWLARYTRDGRQQYMLQFADGELLGLCGDAAGNAYAVLNSWHEFPQYKGRWSSVGELIQYHVMLRIGPGGEQSVFAESVLKGGFLTLESWPVLSPQGELAVYGDEGLLVRFGPAGEPLFASPLSAKLAEKWRRPRA